MTITTPSPISARHDLLAQAARHFDEGHFERHLRERVAMATVSDMGAPGPELAAYLKTALTPQLQRMGFAVDVMANPVPAGGPFLVARRIEGPGLPTVLTYGHGDVVNGQDDRWSAGLQPWAMHVQGDRWYGRGTADNKGQHTLSLDALELTLAARQGRLGYNVTVLMEMGEEAGSPGLHDFCTAKRDLLRADVLLASDGPRVAAQLPTLFLGSRGLVNFKLTVQSRSRGFHSGNWGGVLTNPAVVLSHALACLVDFKGQLCVPGLRPPPIPPEIRRALANVPVGGAPDDPQLDPDWGEPGLSAIERLVAWNTLEVLAFEAGSPQRPVNAIPSRAVAHCQLRFVVGTDWQGLETLVRAHLAEAGFSGVEVEVTASSPATRLDLGNPWVDWVSGSMARTTGKPVTVLPNLAGTLPNEVFSEVLGLPTLWVPHSYPACSQHAPNEHLLGSVAREGLQIMAGLYWDLGETASAPWSARTLAPG